MPFKSEAQRRYLWANHPKIAERWAEHTPAAKKMAEKKSASFLLGEQLAKQAGLMDWIDKNYSTDSYFENLTGQPWKGFTVGKNGSFNSALLGNTLKHNTPLSVGWEASKAIPLLGAIPAGIDAIRAGLKGEWGDAALNTLAAIPFAGTAAKGISAANKFGKFGKYLNYSNSVMNNTADYGRLAGLARFHSSLPGLKQLRAPFWHTVGAPDRVAEMLSNWAHSPAVNNGSLWKSVPARAVAWPANMYAMASKYAIGSPRNASLMLNFQNAVNHAVDTDIFQNKIGPPLWAAYNYVDQRIPWHQKDVSN